MYFFGRVKLAIKMEEGTRVFWCYTQNMKKKKKIQVIISNLHGEKNVEILSYLLIN